MVEIKSIRIDGEQIHMFKSAIYLFESSTGYTLEVAMIVSEVALRRYKNEENLIIEIDLEDGRVINAIMHPQGISNGLPQLNLFCDVNGIGEYQDFHIVRESDLTFPTITDGITLEEIREYEMPDEKVQLKLTLPIDQVEWIAKQKKSVLNQLIKEAIYEYWKR